MLAPLFILAGALACGIPIFLHFLRPKPRRIIHFPTLKFLQPAVLRESRRHKILRWLVLALRCLALLLIAFAFARPLLNQAGDNSDTAVIFVIDNSFSMQADARWAAALQWALDEAGQLPSDAEAGILLMRPEPEWVVPFGEKLSSVSQRLTQLQPGYDETDYRGALRLAGERLRESPAKDKRIVLLGDHQLLGWRHLDFNEPLPPGVTLRTPPAPVVPQDQIALTDMQILEETNGQAAVVSLMPFLVSQPEHSVTLWADDEIVDVATVTLLAGQPARVRFALPAGKARIKAELDRDDLTADNVIYATDQRSQQLALMLPPTNGVDYLAMAIESTALAEKDPLQVIDWPAGDWPSDAIAVLRGDAPFSAEQLPRIKSFLSGGGKAMLFYNGSPAQAAWLKEQDIVFKPAEGKALTLRDWDLEHPALQPFAEGDISPLLQLKFKAGHGLAPESVWPIARWPDRSVALAEAEIGGGTVVIAGFTPGGGDSLVRSAPFVPLIHGLASWLAGHGAVTETWRVGQTLELTPGQWEAIDGPDQGAVTEVAGSVRLAKPGVYRFTPESGATALYAVNLPLEESDLRAWPNPADFERLENPVVEDTQARVMLSPLESGIWWWLLAFAVMLLPCELRLSNVTAR